MNELGIPPIAAGHTLNVFPIDTPVLDRFARAALLPLSPWRRLLRFGQRMQPSFQ